VAIEVPAGQTRRQRSRRASAGVFAVLAVAAVGISGCAAGRNAQTAYEKPTIDGAQAKVGYLSLNGLTIIAPTSAYYRKGSSAPVRLVLVNSGASADTLTGITSPAFSGWGVFSTAGAAQAAQAAATASASTSISPSSGASPAATGARQVRVPANSRVPFGTPEAKGALLLTNLAKSAYPGSAVPITFTFAKAGAVTVQVPVGLTHGAPISVLPSPSGGGE
jgi:copper(I)-binding protein